MVCSCGRDVRLRAMHIRFNGKRGIAHYLEHVDGTAVCVPGSWSCSMLKPYPKNEDDKPYRKMMLKFTEAQEREKGGE